MDPSQECARLADYERHFNVIQAGIRGLASTWMLAAFGAFSFFLRPEVAAYCAYHLNIVDLDLGAYIGMSTVALVAFSGLLALWILDQLVYHRLLLSVFLVGLSIELRSRDVPPVRVIMAASDKGSGVALHIWCFYLLPMSLLTAASIVFAALATLSASGAGTVCLVFPVVQALGWYFFWRHRKEPSLGTFVEEGRLKFPTDLLKWFSIEKLEPKEFVQQFIQHVSGGKTNTDRPKEND